MVTRDETTGNEADWDARTGEATERAWREAPVTDASRVLAHDCGNGKLVLTVSGNSDAWLASDVAVNVPQ